MELFAVCRILNCHIGATNWTNHCCSGWPRWGTIDIYCQYLTLNCGSNPNDLVLCCKFNTLTIYARNFTANLLLRPLHAVYMYWTTPKFGCPIFSSNGITVNRRAREKLPESRWARRPWCEYPKIFTHLGSACDNHSAVSTKYSYPNFLSMSCYSWAWNLAQITSHCVDRPKRCLNSIHQTFSITWYQVQICERICGWYRWVVS